MNRNFHPELVTLYADLLPHLKQVALAKGYALAVHGSMKTDLDLIACPWTEEATTAEEIAEALREALCGPISTECKIRYEIFKNVADKPHGRKAFSIYLVDGSFEPYVAISGKPYIDLSVMPRVEIS